MGGSSFRHQLQGRLRLATLAEPYPLHRQEGRRMEKDTECQISAHPELPGWVPPVAVRPRLPPMPRCSVMGALLVAATWRARTTALAFRTRVQYPRWNVKYQFWTVL